MQVKAQPNRSSPDPGLMTQHSVVRCQLQLHQRTARHVALAEASVVWLHTHEHTVFGAATPRGGALHGKTLRRHAVTDTKSAARDNHHQQHTTNDIQQETLTQHAFELNQKKAGWQWQAWASLSSFQPNPPIHDIQPNDAKSTVNQHKTNETKKSKQHAFGLAKQPAQPSWRRCCWV